MSIPRYRSTSDKNTTSFLPKTFSDGVFSNYFNPYPNFTIPSHNSEIRDVVGGQGQNNPVTQMVVDLFTTGYSPAVVSATGVTKSFTPSGSLFLPGPSGKCQRPEDWPWLTNVSAASLSSWSLEAFTKFQEQVPTTISLANSLYELKDIKGLIPKVNLRSLKDSASGNFLGYQFGVLPMIADIKAVVSLADDVAKRIKHLIDINGKASHLSFNRSGEDSSPKAFFVSNNDPSLNNLNSFTEGGGAEQGVEFVRTGCKYIFHVGGSLYQDLIGLEDSTAQLKGLIASSGFNHPGRIIWNAIPYSFVVDWFFSLGKLIDTLSVQPFGGTYNVTNVMWSLKVEATWDIYVRWTPGFTQTRVRAGSARAKSYVRQNGFPAYSVFLTTGTLTPMQQALGMAMIHQRM